MIEIGGQAYALSDPVVIAVLVGAGIVLLFLVLLIVAVRAAGRSARLAEPLAHQLGVLGSHVQQLGQGQAQLQGNIQMVSDTQASAQAQVIQTMERRLADVQQQMQDRLADNAMRQNRALTEMQERMKESLHGSSKQTTASLT